MQIETDGFVVIGDLPNDENYHCLICGRVPDRVFQNLFIPKEEDIPAALNIPNTLVLPYRLCLPCNKTKPEQWKIRLLVLERLNRLVSKP